MDNRIQFKHFYGTKTDWLSRINSSIWKNSIVFGQIKDTETDKWEYKIYAGSITVNSSTIDYIYDISDTSAPIINVNNVHINVSTCNPEDAGLSPEHGDYFVKEEWLSYINGSTGKATIPSDPSTIINRNIEPRRTAYIYDSSLKDGEGGWVALDGNVNAENVYFPLGFLRTKEWGTAQAKDTTDSDKEIIGKNLKEIFEYYLVEEIFKGKIKNASFITSTWSIDASGGKSRPDNLNSYVYLDGDRMSQSQLTTALVKVGTEINIKLISISTTPKLVGNNASVDGTPAKVYEMIKYSNTSIGQLINESSSTGTTPHVDFSYENNFDTATATLLLVSTSNNIISNNSITNSINSSIAINEITANLPECTLKLTLKYSNTLDASRSIDSSVIGTSVEVYPVSNKDNVSTGKLVANGIVPKDLYASAAKSESFKNKNTDVTIKAVYPVYTNGKINSKPNGIGEDENNFKWANNEWHDQESTSENYEEFSVFDDARSIYINVGDFTLGNSSHKPIIFIPNGLGLKINLGSTNGVGAASTEAGKVSVYKKSESLYFETVQNVSLNSINYDMYKLTGVSGPTSLQITLVKK